MRILNYILELFLTKGIGWLTSWFMYVPAYVLRKPIRWVYSHSKFYHTWFILLFILIIFDITFLEIGKYGYALYSVFFFLSLWYYLNDGVSEDGFSKLQQPDGRYNYGWFWKLIGRYPNWHPDSKGGWWNNFIISYKWSGLRNFTWNTYIPFQLEHVEETNVVIKKSICYNEAFNEDVTPIEERHLKFKYEDDSYADNEGPYLNYQKAVLGELSITYTQGKRKCFRWAKVYVKLKKDCILAREIRLGYTDNHSDFFNKIKKLKIDEKSLREYNEYIEKKNLRTK